VVVGLGLRLGAGQVREAVDFFGGEAESALEFAAALWRRVVSEQRRLQQRRQAGFSIALRRIRSGLRGVRAEERMTCIRRYGGEQTGHVETGWLLTATATPCKRTHKHFR